jgi:hypothetical protein
MDDMAGAVVMDDMAGAVVMDDMAGAAVMDDAVGAVVVAVVAPKTMISAIALPCLVKVSEQEAQRDKPWIAHTPFIDVSIVNWTCEVSQLQSEPECDHKHPLRLVSPPLGL